MSVEEGDIERGGLKCWKQGVNFTLYLFLISINPTQKTGGVGGGGEGKGLRSERAKTGTNAVGPY